HAIDRDGLDIRQAAAAGRRSSPEEPLVSVARPGPPLVVPRRVQARDAERTPDDLPKRRTTPDLASRKMDSREQLTSHLSYGHGYPELPLWSEIPFFHGQKKIVLRNCGLIAPGDIDEYLAVGGYQALYKALIDGRPENVIE